MTKINPYDSELPENYTKIMQNFGLDKFDINSFPNPNRLMRRGIVFASRDSETISKCIKEKKPFYVLSGIMPTNNKIHFGNKQVVENIRYFQDQGAKAYILIADLEATAARGISLEEGKKHALEFHIPAYLALGLDPEKTIFYFQSENKEVIHLAYEFANKITHNEFEAIYGNTDPGKIMSAVTQVGDILHPQLTKKIPGIIPVGIDQDPHIRLTRDIAKSKNFFKPSSIYHKYTPSLDGTLKMSKSKPDSCIVLPENIKTVTKKLLKAFTGGRENSEIQKKLGGEPEKCMIFELDKQHLIEDDIELQDIYDKCKSGKRLCGECKMITCKKMENFMVNFEKKLENAKSKVNTLNFIR